MVGVVFAVAIGFVFAMDQAEQAAGGEGET